MIKVPDAPYIGKTCLELIEIETKKKEYGGLFLQPFLLVVNDKVVPKNIYENQIIKEGDEIKLLPLYSGG